MAASNLRRIVLPMAALLTTSAFASVDLADVTGEWTMVVDNSIATIVKLSQTGANVRGSQVSNWGGERPLEGQIAGDSISLTMAPMGRVFTYRGVLVTSDSIRGQLDMGTATMSSFVATRRR